MKKPVLVLGGGIAGIQAAGDLAQMGVPAFLVERGPAIGGRMAQLDKTFPTNDCSACILAPKITACHNHPLVKTFTLSELVELRGEAPEFTAVIKKRARYVDEDLCIGCNACVPKCPVERPSEFDAGIGLRKAVYKPHAQAVPNVVAIEKRGASPCRHACPAGVNIHAAAALAAKGRFAEALDVIRRATPFAGVLGRVCSRPCEGACSLGLVDTPVALGSLERFLADAGDGISIKKDKRTPARPEKIAVAGGGLVGLNCAYRLALAGYSVTVFEAGAEPGGGLLRDSRLPREVLDREIALITGLGVEIRCGEPLGKEFNLNDLKRAGFAAICLATGEEEPIPGLEDASGLPWVFFAEEDGANGPAEAISRGNRLADRARAYLEGDAFVPAAPLLPATPPEQVEFPAVPAGEGRAALGQDITTEEQAQQGAGRCLDCSVCCECGVCERMCAKGAIAHGQRDEIIELPVSAVILAGGAVPHQDIPAGWGYGVHPDVVTSLEYERMLSASGPLGGHIRRPSDGREPRRVAFVQCACSRDETCDAGYCSAVCCMVAVKEAVITREHLPGVAAADIYYMDIRAYGKDFERYVESAKEKYGVGFVRSRIFGVERSGETGALGLRHCGEDGRAAVAEYDLIVLSVGLRPEDGNKELLRRAGIKTQRHGFLWTRETDAPKTSREGIFACGTAAGPKDIPETVVDASAAALEAAGVAGRAGEQEDALERFPLPQEALLRDVSREPVRIGVFVCHCGANIAGYLDVKAVAKYAASLPRVAYAGDLLYACAADSQKTIAERIRRHGLNRIVVASCSPRTHEPLFREVLRGAGLNPYLLTMANIRDQCSWVHMDKWEDATQKAKDLVRMAVARIAPARQLMGGSVGVTKSALVMGGGIAGMSAALSIAGLGFDVALVEKTGALGGNALRLSRTPTGRPLGDYVGNMIARVRASDNIRVYLNAAVDRVEGYVGNFTTTLATIDGPVTIDHGVAVVATGARESVPKEYGYGQDWRVLTQLELEDALAAGGEALDDARDIIMIQCVGSREAERPYCSRVCCTQALLNALRLKEARPDRNVTILYRDICAYGLNEDHYRKARQAGVMFVRYEPDRKPEISFGEEELSLRCYDPVLGDYVTLRADRLVLSAAMEPDGEANRNTARQFKVPLNQDGFFLEAHAKLRPVEFATEGVYVCGLAHAPRTIRESVLQGKAAAARAAAVLSRDALTTEGAIARVTEADCTGCGECERVCAYGAVAVEEKRKGKETVRVATVNPVLCKGCGTCAAACRCGAMDVGGVSDRQVARELESLLRF